jgi:hypothetical protein
MPCYLKKGNEMRFEAIENESEYADTNTPESLLMEKEESQSGDLNKTVKQSSGLWPPCLMDFIELAIKKPMIWHVLKIKLRNLDKSSRMIALECDIDQKTVCNHFREAIKVVPGLAAQLGLKNKK